MFESLRPRKRVRCVTFDHTQIVETKDGWICCKTGEVISDIVIRVTHVVRIRPKAKRGGWLIHSGHATYKRRRFRWHIQCSRGGTLMDMIERKIAARGLGIPMISPLWRKRLLKLAMAFRAPRAEAEGSPRRRQPVIREIL